MILEVLGSSVVSTLAGGILGYFTKRQELKAIEAQNKHERELIPIKTNAAIELKNADIRGEEVKGKLVVEQKEVDSFGESLKTTGDYSGVIKAAVRPLVLLYVGVMCYQNQSAMFEVINGMKDLPKEDVIELFKTTVITTLSLFSTGVGWYFGQRTTKQTDAFMKLLENRFK